jgi:hypothetical protein
MDLIVTIDTEGDDAWRRSKTELSTENLAFIAPFQDLCDRYGVKPTYLCTWEVVEDPRFESLRGYQEAGLAEIGTHLHPWTSPPMERPQNGIDLGALHAFPSELEPALFADKLRLLTERIYERTGSQPRSYRAGRWGFSAEHIPTLIELGYLVDCSVTPCVSWEHTSGFAQNGPDFRTAPSAPYFLDRDDVRRSGQSTLLEVPMTILFTNQRMARSRRLQDLYSRYRRTLPARAINKLFRLEPQWFRPYPHMTFERLKAIYEAAVRERLPAIEMMFHSSELMPGGSPYHRDRAAVGRLNEKLEQVFGYLQEQSCRAMTLTAFARDFTSRASATADRRAVSGRRA